MVSKTAKTAKKAQIYWQFCLSKLPRLGNRQQATGNRQQATGNRQQYTQYHLY
jgi:hypothetical protein